MYGWRARIGFISPPVSAETPVIEFYRIVPEGVAMVVACGGLRDFSLEELDGVADRLQGIVEDLDKRKVDYIVVGGTPVVFTRPGGSTDLVLRRVQEMTRTPVSTTATASLTAMRHLGVRSVVVPTPYSAERNAKLKAFLESEGIEVLAMRGLDKKLQEIHELTLEFTAEYSLATYRDAPQADAIYMPCARISMAENIQRLEAELGKPVITNTTAMIWQALRDLDVREPITRYGQLLASLQQEARAEA